MISTPLKVLTGAEHNNLTDLRFSNKGDHSNFIFGLRSRETTVENILWGTTHPITMGCTLHLIILENPAVQSLKGGVLFLPFQKVTARHRQGEKGRGKKDNLFLSECAELESPLAQLIARTAALEPMSVSEDKFNTDSKINDSRMS